MASLFLFYDRCRYLLASLFGYRTVILYMNKWDCSEFDENGSTRDYPTSFARMDQAARTAGDAATRVDVTAGAGRGQNAKGDFKRRVHGLKTARRFMQASGSEDHINLADGFLDFPQPFGVGFEKERVAAREMNRFFVVGREASAPCEKVNHFGLFYRAPVR